MEFILQPSMSLWSAQSLNQYQLRVNYNNIINNYNNIISMWVSIDAADKDFKGTDLIVQFNDFTSEQTLSTVAEIEIVDDVEVESTESFQCVISGALGDYTDRVIINDPAHYRVAIEDNDGKLILVTEMHSIQLLICMAAMQVSVCTVYTSISPSVLTGIVTYFKNIHLIMQYYNDMPNYIIQFPI